MASISALMIPREVSVSAADDTMMSARAHSSSSDTSSTSGKRLAEMYGSYAMIVGLKPMSFWAIRCPIRPSPMMPMVRDRIRWSSW